MEQVVRCLVVDDEAPILRVFERIMNSMGGFDLTTAASGDEALILLDDLDAFDLVVTDIRMAGATGHDVVKRVRQRQPWIPVLVMSAVASLNDIERLLVEGATLFLRKPFALPELELLLKHAHTLAAQLALARGLTEVAPRAECKLPGLVGRSPAFLQAVGALPQLARTELPVLVVGETGTGKELVARALHALSRRAAGPMVAVNCSALTDSLVDSELFGHEKGSFTGAQKDHAGLVRAADGGTLFLDEIGDLAAGAQAKLLRVLQEKEVRPVGCVQPVRVNVRVVAATHRDLQQMVRDGQFREDLYYRLKVARVRLPPLRERPDDILMLARLFLERAREEVGSSAVAFSPEATDLLLRHTWPGNIRELQATVFSAAAVCIGPAIGAQDLALEDSVAAPPPRAPPPAAPAADGRAAPPAQGYMEARNAALQAFDLEYFRTLLAAFDRMSDAAAHAGLDRKTLWRMLKRHGLQDSRGRAGAEPRGGETEEDIH
ncbi:MAG: sigma-54-dependent Fis family transcriptional regulator [Deltaproteobacteria bacterium]|nr:sigma-54-dependent Fis family transcriptional regulator [Deltaproteobacteria bacterium]